MSKISKNQLRRQKAKEKKQEKLKEVVKDKLSSEITKENKIASITKFQIDENDPAFQQFKYVFDKFQVHEPEEDIPEELVFYNDEEVDVTVDDADNNSKISKRQQRLRDKIPLAVLKAESARPDIVEWYDSDAPDARFLIFLKNLKNVVPVPPHWASKREYLSNKRAVERLPFKLPQFIEDTGISDMRDLLRDDELTLKEKMRGRVQPKMGKLDLDYALLHNAFFHQQKKPKLYGYGDVYYEGKEFQSKFDFENFKPGKISMKLSNALGIVHGSIPPWVPNMQKYGLPPSYPNLRIPGLNDDSPVLNSEEIDKSHWAQLAEDDDDEESEVEEEGEEEQDLQYAQGSDDDENVEAIPISELGADIARASQKDIHPEDLNRPLYQVLEQKEDKYALAGDIQPTQPLKSVVEQEEEEEESTGKKFRF